MMFGLTLCLVLYWISLTLGQVPSPPYFVSRATGKEVLVTDEDTIVDIMCKALGHPAPTYRWEKDGVPFNWQQYPKHMSATTKDNHLSFSIIDDTVTGQYQCFAENKYGVAVEPPTFLRKATFTNINMAPSKTYVGIEGESFQLYCHDAPDGYPKPILKWVYRYSNGSTRPIYDERIITDPEGNLWFSSLTKADRTFEFAYACSANSPKMEEYDVGNNVLLKVLSTGISPSLIKHEPIQQYVTEEHTVALKGRHHKLYCIFGGTPFPQIVWFKNGEKIQFSFRVTLEKNGRVLVIRDVNHKDQGIYKCEASNGIKEAKSYSTSLIVQSLPYFVKQPVRINAIEGEKVKLRCEAHGVPKPQIEWIYNGKPIAEAPPNPNRRIIDNGIVFDSVSKKDIGNYGCNASNTQGYIYKDAFVNILYVPPKILEAPRNTEVVAGQNTILVCRATGSPKPEIIWTKNYKAVVSGGKYTIEQNGDLSIANVQAEDTGNYGCIAQNRYGSAVFDYFNQTVALVLKNSEP